MPYEPFNDADLFACTQCGACCKGYGGTYVTPADIAVIADFILVSPDEFEKRYCVPSGHRLLLAQREDGYCIFWDQNCTIHPVKPRMCRKWPFIESLLVDIINWQIMADSCPGMQHSVSEDTLKAYVQRQLATSRES